MKRIRPFLMLIRRKRSPGIFPFPGPMYVRTYGDRWLVNTRGSELLDEERSNKSYSAGSHDLKGSHAEKIIRST